MNVKAEGKAHRAVTDCLMTLGVIQAMGEQATEKEETKKSCDQRKVSA